MIRHLRWKVVATNMLLISLVLLAVFAAVYFISRGNYHKNVQQQLYQALEQGDYGRSQPGMDGFALLRQLRGGGSRLPVLMLTARSELNDRVRGLDAGADYYLTKPFEPEELLACIRSLLRRGGEDAAADPEVTAFGDLTLHMGTFLLECGPRSVRLSRREYDLMELLMRNGSQIVSKEQLILKVWGYDSAAEDNNVEVYISFLRRKLTHLQSTVKIKTLRMVGYCLEVEA